MTIQPANGAPIAPAPAKHNGSKGLCSPLSEPSVVSPIVAWSSRYGFAARHEAVAPLPPAAFNVTSLLRHGFAAGVGFAARALPRRTLDLFESGFALVRALPYVSWIARRQ